MEANVWKKDFPQIQQGMVYLDSAAMSLKPQSVIDAVNYYYRDLSVNIHRGLYPSGVLTTHLYEEAREKVAEYLHATADEIVFTRGTTSSLNLVALSYGATFLKKGDVILTSELEHHSSYLPWREIALKVGATIRFVPLTKEGRITVEAFSSVLDEHVKVVALTHVSNVMGFVTPIQEITKLAHQMGAIVVLDAAQSLPHYHVNVLDLDVDFLAFSGHKMLGPTGVGVLYGKKALLDQMPPVEFGGDMNDDVSKDDVLYKDAPQKFEAGTMPIAEILGFKAAIDYLNRVDVDAIERHTVALHRYAMARLSKIDGIEIYNPTTESGIIAFNLTHVPPHDAISFYGEKNICMRSGHHCAKLVSRFLGITGCLRASFYLYNDFKDVDLFVDTTKEAISFFKNMGF